MALQVPLRQDDMSSPIVQLTEKIREQSCFHIYREPKLASGCHKCWRYRPSVVGDDRASEGHRRTVGDSSMLAVDMQFSSSVVYQPQTPIYLRYIHTLPRPPTPSAGPTESNASKGTFEAQGVTKIESDPRESESDVSRFTRYQLRTLR